MGAQGARGHGRVPRQGAVGADAGGAAGQRCARGRVGRSRAEAGRDLQPTCGTGPPARAHPVSLSALKVRTRTATHSQPIGPPLNVPAMSSPSGTSCTFLRLQCPPPLVRPLNPTKSSLCHHPRKGPLGDHCQEEQSSRAPVQRSKLPSAL